MRKILVIAAILTLCASSAFAALETFSYADGNLNGQGGWSGSDAGSIVVENQTVKITSNATGTLDANLTVPTEAIEGMICVSYDYKMQAGNPEFFADVFARDAAGNYLGWMYMAAEGYWDEGAGPQFANGIVRGRGPAGIVVYLVGAGDYAWHNYCMKINTGTQSTEYFVDGVSIGSQSHMAEAGDAVQTLQLTSWNRSHTQSFGYYDNLGIVGGDVCIPEPSSLVALSMFGLGALGFIRRRS